MNKIFLWLIMLLAGLWKSMGADVGQLREILNVRLIMDDRSPFQVGRPKAQKKSGKMYSLLQMFIYGIIGFIYTFPLWFIQRDLLLGLTGYYTFFLFFLWFTLVISFSGMLIDNRDNLILLPRPINDRTLVLSRLLHIVIYLFRMVLPMSIPGWIILAYVKGWQAAVLFPVPVILLVFLTLFLVNAVYLLIIRLAGPSRFKDVLSTFQIIFSILLFGSYYLLPRLLDASAIQSLDITQLGWIRLLPSYWLAAMWTWIYQPEFTLPGTSFIGLLSILIPLIAIWGTVRFLAPRFMQALAGGEEVVRPAVPGSKNLKGSSRLYRQLSLLLNRRQEAQAGFELAWLQTARNRNYKMKVYPALAYIPIYFFFMFLQKPDMNSTSIMERLSSPWVLLALMYMCTFALIQAVTNIYFSEQYKASWVYYARPVGTPGNVMAGAFKAVYIKYYFPFAAVISVFVIALGGWTYIFDVLLAQMNILIFVLITMRMGSAALPFSLKEQMKQRGGKAVIRMVVTLLAIPIIGGAHYLAVKFWMLKIIVLPLTGILCWMLWDSYIKTTWNAILQPDADE